MATSTYKQFDQTPGTGDIVLGGSKKKLFPAWSDLSSDLDTIQTAEMTSFYSSSVQISSIEGLYYWNIYQENPNVGSTTIDSETQFSIAYGHTSSLLDNGHPTGLFTADISNMVPSLGDQYKSLYQPWAIYRQIASAVTNKGDNGNDGYTPLTYTTGITGATAKEMGNIYIIALSRGRVKDYLDQNSWKLTLSNSVSIIAAPSPAVNTMDFNTIVSGTNNICGRFYAEKGLIILDADILLASGALSQSALNAGKVGQSISGNRYYTASLAIDNFYKSISIGSYFKARSVEDVQSTHYFVRGRNYEFNYSSNPTWRSGSSSNIIPAFYDEPRTYISSIGLYDQDESGIYKLLAIAKLSKPIAKAADSEILVKVRLDY